MIVVRRAPGPQLDERTVSRIVRLVRANVPRWRIAEAIGIRGETLSRWIQRGKSETGTIHADLAERVAAIEAEQAARAQRALETVT